MGVGIIFNIGGYGLYGLLADTGISIQKAKALLHQICIIWKNTDPKRTLSL